MEFLECSLKIYRKLVLSCLNYLLENKKALRYFDDWNSSLSNLNSTQLLLKIYKDEDKKFHVQYKNGIL